MEIKEAFLAKFWRQNKLVICINIIMLAALVASNYSGYRICNCAVTEKWAPGGAGVRGGVGHFYHK